MKLTIYIPDEQYDRLEKVAKDVSAYISSRLKLVEGLDPHNPPLTLLPGHIRQLNELLGITLKTPQQLLDHIRASQLIRMGDGIEIDLPSDDIYQLQQIALGMGAASFPEYMREFVEEAVSMQLHGSCRAR